MSTSRQRKKELNSEAVFIPAPVVLGSVTLVSIFLPAGLSLVSSAQQELTKHEQVPSQDTSPILALPCLQAHVFGALVITACISTALCRCVVMS